MKRIEYRRQVQKLKKKFRLTIFNESTLENFFSLRVSLLDGIFLGASVMIVLFFFSWLLLVHTPMRAFLPQDLDPGMRKKLVQQAIRVDSLSNTLDLQANYMKVLNGIIAGDLPMDSVKKDKGKLTIDSLALKQFKLMPASRREQKFREDYEENEKYNLSILGTEDEKKEVLFHAPIVGRVTSSFNPKLKNHGIRIETSDEQPSVAVLAGTVLFAAYTSDYDYVIQIQHSNDYVSVYKYNTELLKKQGDKVKAGEAIGMVGVSPARAGLPFLYFELWKKGIPLNPEEYIVF
jgi:murein DD-endopeptidase MepM/ murein hydrolase activator NlpD